MKILDLKESNLTADELIALMTLVGNELPEPLSMRVDIPAYLEKITNNGECYILIDSKQGPAGFIGFYTNDKKNRKAYLSIISILPHFQGKGYGKKLMELMISKCVEMGMIDISLEVQSTNIKAINCYKKFGFNNVAIKADKIVMCKNI